MPPYSGGRLGALPNGGIRAMRRIARLIRDEKGASAVEYSLILALIVLALIAGLQMFANSAIGMWNGVATNVQQNT